MTTERQDLKIFFAPVQGHTDAAYRAIHAEAYGDADAYFTPFIRAEKGEPRRRDMADAFGRLNDGHRIVPQVIFRDSDELRCLLDALQKAGAKEADLNMGCPFPLQTARGRGAAVIGNKTLVEETAETIGNFPDISFSIKIRLGMLKPDEWKHSIDIINRMPLTHLTVHPRVARQQYSGEPDLDSFKEIIGSTETPLIYNGDISSPEGIRRVHDMFPSIAGVMIGRGLLRRPSLILEYRNRQEMPQEERIRMMLDFHDRLFTHYKNTLCGDSQVLSKIKPFWEFAESEIGRKPWKAIKKASSMPKYISAVAMI